MELDWRLCDITNQSAVFHDTPVSSLCDQIAAQSSVKEWHQQSAKAWVSCLMAILCGSLSLCCSPYMELPFPILLSPSTQHPYTHTTCHVHICYFVARFIVRPVIIFYVFFLLHCGSYHSWFSQSIYWFCCFTVPNLQSIS